MLDVSSSNLLNFLRPHITLKQQGVIGLKLHQNTAPSLKSLAGVIQLLRRNITGCTDVL